MNESEKNIETCLPESILAEVASVPTDPQFVSLVNESLDPLKQQAVQQAGSDAYNEVVASHQPYTFTSQVAQMKSNLILLLRRLWRFPFGSGTIRSLSDMWAHYITRLQGSETYGIPSRLDQLTDLPSAPLLVADRKISGVPEAVDGMSIPNLLCSIACETITEITDSNNGWIANKQMPNLLSIFPNLKKLTIGCKETCGQIISQASIEEMNFSNLERVYSESAQSSYNVGDATIKEIIYGYTPPTKRITAPKLRTIEKQFFYYTSHAWAQTIEELEMPELVDILDGGGLYCAYSGDSKLKRVILPKLEGSVSLSKIAGIGGCSIFATDGNTLTALEYLYIGYNTNDPSRGVYLNDGSSGKFPNLIKIEFKDGIGKNINLSGWGASEAIANNLQQFLQNVRSYIMLRLTKRTSTSQLTLTLSPAVYQKVYGLDTNYNVDPSTFAQTATLGDLGITTEDLTETEVAAGITVNTIYATWLDTYRGAIYWNIGHS